MMCSSVDLPEPERPTSDKQLAVGDRQRHGAQHRLGAVDLADGLEADHARFISRTKSTGTILERSLGPLVAES